MNSNTKYNVLTNYLLSSNQSEIKMDYKKFEDVIGKSIESLNHEYEYWGSNLKSVISDTWLNAGYSIKLNKRPKQVIFKKLFSNDKPITNKNLEESEFEISKSAYGEESEQSKRIINKLPYNTDLGEIILKIALIDFTHSTQFSRQKKRVSIVELAKVILNITDFDNRVKNGDLNLVHEIASGTKVNLISLASKYCAIHNQYYYKKDDYYKFDKLVCEQIGYKEKNYKEYHNILDTIVRLNKLEHIKDVRRKIDHHYWYSRKKEMNGLV